MAFWGAFKDFNEVLDFVEDRGTQWLGLDIANDIGSASGFCWSGWIVQALEVRTKPKWNSSIDMWGRKLIKLLTVEVWSSSRYILKVLANNYVVSRLYRRPH